MFLKVFSFSPFLWDMKKLLLHFSPLPDVVQFPAELPISLFTTNNAFFSRRAGVCWGPEMSSLMLQSTGFSLTSLAVLTRDGARRASGAPSLDLLSPTCQPAGDGWSRTIPSSPWNRAGCLKQ